MYQDSLWNRGNSEMTYFVGHLLRCDSVPNRESLQLQISLINHYSILIKIENAYKYCSPSTLSNSHAFFALFLSAPRFLLAKWAKYGWPKDPWPYHGNGDWFQTWRHQSSAAALAGKIQSKFRGTVYPVYATVFSRQNHVSLRSSPQSVFPAIILARHAIEYSDIAQSRWLYTWVPISIPLVLVSE